MKKNILFLIAFLCASFCSLAQVTQINSNNSLDVILPLNNNKTIVVSDIDSSLWATDATLPGTVQLSADIAYEDLFALLSGKFIFRGSTAATGSEMYISDGTAAGTLLIKDIVAGPMGSAPGDMVMLNGFVYFTAVTAAEGRELWRTDGTEAGTTLVKDVFPGPDGSNTVDEYNLYSNGTYLLFAARTPDLGIELWKSDGTPGGTVLLKDISVMADSSNPRAFYKYNNTVLFVARDTAHGEEIWKTDGTAGGTVLVKDIKAGKESSTTYRLSVPGFPQFDVEFPIFLAFHLFNNKVYFNASDGDSNGQVWSSDGTEGNTSLLKDILPDVAYPSFPIIFIFDAVNFPGKFIFPVSDGEERSELWESDGTPAGTKLFKAFTGTNPGEFPYILLSNNFNFVTQELSQPLFQGNKFFFIANDAAKGRELWISDGTLAQTNIVKDINLNTADGVDVGSGSYVYTTGALYFAANDGANGNELWKSDGTEAGTALVQDINPNEANADPDLPFFLSNGKIIFSATNGDDPARTDLYVVDGNFTPLPIKVTEFTVMLKNKDAVLHWSTLNELNSKDFTIQRSYDGRLFKNIGTVSASTSAAIKHDYAFTDENISSSGNTVIYYRIIAADKNGKTETTNIIFVKLKGDNNWSVRLLTNPVQNYADILLNGITKEVKMSIKDLSGRIHYSTSRQNINGQINIPVASLQRGMYLLVTESNSERKVIQFIKQ